MSSKRYIEDSKKLSYEQRSCIYDCYMKGTNRDGHTWVTWSDVEELICDLVENDYCYEDDLK